MPTPAAQPHDPLEALFEDVFWVQGSIELGPDRRINRNMVVLREGDALTLIHPVRLSPEGERALERLGTVSHIVRLSAQHGVDDRYYVERYGAAFWCQAGSTIYPDPAPTHILAEGAPLPVSDATLFVFRDATMPEGALLLQRHGGLLITGDSLHNWTSWNQCSDAAIALLQKGGFSLTMLVGPVWQKRVTPEGGSLKPDFERLLALGFQHHIGAHGALARDNAHKMVEAAVANAFSA
jgi:hypothetical protein